MSQLEDFVLVPTPSSRLRVPCVARDTRIAQGNAPLTLEEFSEFYHDLAEEQLHQQWVKVADPVTARVSVQDFKDLTKFISSSKTRFTAPVIRKMGTLFADMRGADMRGISYGELRAFVRLVHILPEIEAVVSRECSVKKCSKREFLRCAMYDDTYMAAGMSVGDILTPLQLAIFWDLFVISDNTVGPYDLLTRVPVATVLDERFDLAALKGRWLVLRSDRH